MRFLHRHCKQDGILIEWLRILGAPARAILGWLANLHGAEADMNIELLALRRQQQLVEDDSQVGGSDRFSGSESVLGTLDRATTSRIIPIHGAGLADGDLLERLYPDHEELRS